MSRSLDREFAVGEVIIGDDLRSALPPQAIPLAVARKQGGTIAYNFDELYAGDRVLVMAPRAPLREGKDTLAAAAERFLQRS